MLREVLWQKSHGHDHDSILLREKVEAYQMHSAIPIAAIIPPKG